MKPELLKVSGFTAFRHEAVIDFRGRGLFVITGPTGAGKSSLLDAITWALYGRVPRVGSEVRHLLAHGEQQMSVLFEFSVRGRHYRVARRHPGGTSTRLEVLTGDRWVPEADRARDVLHRVESILGMNYETFTRVILLPQGQFDAFLRGDTTDRRKLLSELIGLDVYQRAGELARALVSRHRTQADTILAQLPRLAGATPEAIADRREELSHLEARMAAAEQHRIALDTVQQRWGNAETMRGKADRAVAEARTAAQQAADAEEKHRRSHEALARVAAEVTRLLAERTALAYDREAHERLRAQVLLLDQRLQAEADLATARAELDRAIASAEAAEHTRAQDAATLVTAREALDEAATVLAARTSDLATVAGLGQQVCTTLDAERVRLEEQAAQAESSARASEQRARELATLAMTIAEAEHALAEAVTAVTSAEQALAEDAEAHARAVEARARAEETRRTAQTGLDQARRAHAAADLRMGLQAGDRCPVCGEPIATIEHAPAPDLVRAEQILVEAEQALATARQDAEATVTAQAASVARRDEAAARMAAARNQLDGLAQQAAALALTTDAVAAAATQAERQAAAHGEHAAEHRAAATTIEHERRTLLDALGRVPDTINPDAAPGATAAPASPLAVSRALSDALEKYGLARDSFSRADARAREAAAAATLSGHAADAAARAAQQAGKTLNAATARLESMGGVAGDPQAIRAALARADELARAAHEVEETLRRVREAAASAETAAAAAQAALEAARGAAEHRESERRAAVTARDEAERALAEVWRQTIGGSDQSATALQDAVAAARAQEQLITTDIGSTRTALAQLEQQLEDAEALRQDAAQHQARADLVSRVANDLRGDRFVAFLLHESMQRLAADSSHYLGQFTDGRYRLIAENGEFRVIDHLNADEQRSVKTLSGGETFLASLALALALSERLPELAGTGGAVSLDSLFLDEGFGALDPESLDLAVQGLESLASGQRMIGVISHVAELADRVPDQIRVKKTAAGSIISD